MGAKWLKISILYLIFGVALGMFMSGTLQLQWAALHAHVNLAGWASIAIIGLIYSVYPKAGNSKLGIWSFWLYNIGMPIFFISIFMIYTPSLRAYAHTLTFIGGPAAFIGIILVAVNLFKNVHGNDAITRQ